MPKEERWYDDPDKRWEAIGCLVKKYGTYEDELAWMLCRSDAAEWRTETQKFKNAFFKLAASNLEKQEIK